MNDMLVKFMEKVEEMAKPNRVIAGDREYYDKSLNPMTLPKHPSIKLSTLRGFIDYVKNAQQDNNALPYPLLIKVNSYEDVSLSTSVYGPFNQRDTIAEVKAITPTFEFGRWNEQESFIINLNSKFINTPDLDIVRRVASAVIDQEEVKQEDDGVGQKVTIKSGISKVTDETVRPIVELTPFRTFLEVDQPSSNFLFRIRKGGSFALFEADGGAWKIEAARNIYDYLCEYLIEEIKDGKLIVVM